MLISECAKEGLGGFKRRIAQRSAAVQAQLSADYCIKLQPL